LTRTCPRRGAQVYVTPNTQVEWATNWPSRSRPAGSLKPFSSQLLQSSNRRLAPPTYLVHDNSCHRRLDLADARYASQRRAAE
jgi:hypothetical protein